MKNIKKYLVILFAIAMMLALTACGTHKVDIAPYLSVSYKGNNGEAVARPNLDWIELEYEIMSNWKEKDQSWWKLEELAELEDTIQFDLQTVEGLRNGDKFTVTVTYDRKKAKKVGCTFKNLKKTFTVEGLKDAVVIDPFDESIFGPGKTVDVHFEGLSPFVSVYIYNQAANGEPYSLLTYQIDKMSDLANGDTITVTASSGRRFDENGYVLSRTETTLEIQGFHSYVTDASLLNRADVEWMQGCMKERFETQMRSGTPICLCNPKENRVTVGGSTGGTWSEPDFWNYGFATMETTLWLGKYVLLCPFSVDIEDTKRLWWEGEYYEDGIVTPFPDACGYFIIKGLELDAAGNVCRDSFNISGMKLFINQECMDNDILDNYGRLTPQNFN